MKKEDAEKKWCPMVRFVIGPQSAQWQEQLITNRFEMPDHQNTHCLAEACAVWVPSDGLDPTAGRCGLIRS